MVSRGMSIPDNKIYGIITSGMNYTTWSSFPAKVQATILLADDTYGERADVTKPHWPSPLLIPREVGEYVFQVPGSRLVPKFLRRAVGNQLPRPDQLLLLETLFVITLALGLLRLIQSYGGV